MPSLCNELSVAGSVSDSKTNYGASPAFSDPYHYPVLVLHYYQQACTAGGGDLSW